MDEEDRRLRNTTYALFVELGRAPALDEVAGRLGTGSTQVQEGWRRLHDAHALVLDPDGAIRMANPFSAVATPYRVAAAGRDWFANCAWDAFGICAALHEDGDISSTCPDCGTTIEVAVRATVPSDPSLVFHCLVPAAAWWDDIAFT